jgi:hypothetical protein
LYCKALYILVILYPTSRAFFNSTLANVAPLISSRLNNNLWFSFLGNTGKYKSLGGVISHLTNPKNLPDNISSGVVFTYFLNPTA